MFLKNIYLFPLILVFSLCNSYCQDRKTDVLINSVDEQIVLKILSDHDLGGEFSISELMVKIGMNFMDTPYAPHTLEHGNDERLVIDLSKMDCTTFVEYCLAFARTIVSNSNSLHDFYERLMAIRYRNGQIDGYASRLHYFSDWIFENDRQGIISDVTCELGGVIIERQIDFMSKNPDNYPILQSDPEVLKSIIEFEKIISEREYCYIPKEDVSGIFGKIKSGDIIAITTAIEGLDIMHTGIAVKKGNQIHLLHASTREKKVVISENNLAEYLSGIKSANGIMVARPR